MLDYFQTLIANCAVEWRAIPEYGGRYEASSSGLIRSVRRKCRHKSGSRTVREKILALTPMNSGYLSIRLENKTSLAHRLIASAFYDRPSGSPRFVQVDHIDNNKHNNRPSNLRYCTSAMNTSKRVVSRLAGTQRAGADSWSSYIWISGERIYLGNFQRRDDAVAARVEYASRVLGDYAPIRREP